MEASFQADKKQLLGQHDAVCEKLKRERDDGRKLAASLQEQLEQCQAAVHSEQISREQDTSQHANVIREFQNIVTSERDLNSGLTQQLQEVTAELRRLDSLAEEEDMVQEYEEQVRSLTHELADVKCRLASAERRADQPPPLILQLQGEISTMKEEHTRLMEGEQRRASEAEERLQTQAQVWEQRVSSLEARLSELSHTVGKYDREKEQDTLNIQKLKERIIQLDCENTALTRTQIERRETVDNATAEQLSTLQERVARLKAFLKISALKVNEKITLPPDVEELSVGDYAELLGSEPSRKEYQKELYQLKDEFERYKLRAQSVLRSKTSASKDTDSPSSSSSSSSHRELKELQSRNHELQTRLEAWRGQCEEMEERLVSQTQKLRREMREMNDGHKQELSSLEAQHKKKLFELQQTVELTRERTMKVLSEKDSDLAYLKGELQNLTPLLGTPTTPRHTAFTRALSTSLPSSQHCDDSPPSEPNNDTASLNLPPPLILPSSSSSTVAVQELLDQSSPSLPSSQGEAPPPLLHYAQEQQRRETEVTAARRRRLELEDAVRDLEEREQKRKEQTVFLKQEIRKMERDRSRETENLEYLKNVVIHYMSADAPSQEQLLVPIATVLHFSSDEVEHIKRKLLSSRPRWL